MKSDQALSTSGLARSVSAVAPRALPLPPSPPPVVQRTPHHPVRRRWIAPGPTDASTRQRDSIGYMGAGASTRSYPGAPSWILALLHDGAFYVLVLAALTLSAMTFFFLGSRERIIIRIGEQAIEVWTRQQTVRGVLTEAGISWNPEDIIQPGLDAPVPENGQIFIRPAIPVVISADGNLLERRTQASTISEVLAENGITLKPQDQVLLQGRLVRADTALPTKAADNALSILAVPRAGPLEISVRRALPIVVNDNGATTTLYTTENTIGAALTRAGLELYLGDSIVPDLTTSVTSGIAVFIRRSRPVSIQVDGRIINTRTRRDTIAALLEEQGIRLEGKDYVVPALTSTIVDHLTVNVTRVREVFYTETESLAFETKWVPDPELELDQRVVAQTGAKGTKNRLFKSVYENGVLVSTALEREWISKPPQDHIIHYGTKIHVRDLTLPDGSVVQYWRKIRLLATAYTAATSGKTRDHPQYGKTRLGLNAGRGIVAVDPRVIALGSNVYVPGYGLAFAGDTGGRIKGRRIDLGFPEDALEDWYRWVDVYVLTPVPPPNQINVLLPDYPVERHSHQR